jgi:molybdopterin/thiamine biosynthesis adenylyltransferase
MSAADVLVIGAGGIGHPAALALAEAGVRTMALADEDQVELSNLHRQILFCDDDVGRAKLDALADALARRFPALAVTRLPGRVLPDVALERVALARVVVDATDNFASRFLIADACHLAGVPVVHAAAVRWRATVLAVRPEGRPCYRCLFEDIPRGVDAPDCATAGVIGPVCGVAGAIAADRAMRILAGDTSAFGAIVTFDGLRDVLREVRVPSRPACPLCGDAPTLTAITPERYEATDCTYDGTF